MAQEDRDWGRGSIALPNPTHRPWRLAQNPAQCPTSLLLPYPRQSSRGCTLSSHIPKPCPSPCPES